MVYAKLFAVLFSREWLVYKKRLRGLFISFLGIRVITFAFQEGYVKPLMYFGSSMDRRALMIIGGILIKRVVLRTFDFAYAYFNDMHHQKHIWFQKMAAPSFLIYITRLCFSTCAAYGLMFFFLPIMKIYLWSHLDVSHAHWPLYAVILLCITYMITSFSFFCMTVVTTQKGTVAMRLRVSDTLLLIGAFHATWAAMYSVHPVWGYIALCSPFTYATESFRHALHSGADLLPLPYAVAGLVVWSALFTFVGARIFARRAP